MKYLLHKYLTFLLDKKPNLGVLRFSEFYSNPSEICFCRDGTMQGFIRFWQDPKGE